MKRKLAFDDVRTIQFMKSQIWDLLSTVDFSDDSVTQEKLEYAYAHLHVLEHEVVRSVIGRFPTD